MNQQPSFRTKTIEQLLRAKWQENTKITGDGLKLTTEYFRLFIVEALQRAAHYAKEEGLSQIEPEHIEKVLPQLLLDFA